MASGEGEWTLTEAAALLGVPQHRLIYLCEKAVVIPDLGGAEGRGSSRRFSARNLLEFAVALRLRELEVSTSLIGAVLQVLRRFERTVEREIPGFALPGGLRRKGAPELRVVIGDGRRLFFSLGKDRQPPKVFGGVDLEEVVSGSKRGPIIEVDPARRRDAGVDPFGRPEGSHDARLEVSVSRIARDLDLSR